MFYSTVASRVASELDCEMALDDQQEEPVAPLRPAVKKITTYAGRSRRAVTEDVELPPFGSSNRDDDDDDDEAMQKAASSPILSSLHTPLFPTLRHTKTTARKSQSKTSTWASASAREPEQLILDLGQRIRIRCSECEMQYDMSSAEDCTLHARHHERTVKGLDWSAKALLVSGEVVSTLMLTRRLARAGKSVLRGKQTTGGSSEAGPAESVVVRCYDMASLKDAVATRKISELLQTVDEALGAAPVTVGEIQGCKVLVAVCAGRAAGAAVVGRVPPGHAREVVPSSANKENNNLDASSNVQGTTVWNDAGDAIFVSPALPPAETPPIGVFRIHVIPSWRRTGLASALLDTAADNSVYGFDLVGLVRMYGSRARSVAFSQPTEAGRKLAEAWIRKDQTVDAKAPRLVVFEA